MGGKGGSAPDAPDYTGAAQATAQGNLEAARAAAAANRVSQYTPYGNLVYSHVPGGGPDDWQSNITLSPTGQKLLDMNNQSMLGLGGLQNSAMGRVGDTLSQPFDYSSVGDVQNAAQKAVTDRLDPMWDANQKAQENKLANQGLQPGTEAYENAMRSFSTAKNDAYQQAVLAGINTMPQTYQMASAIRNQPLNELNALRNGSQVQNPVFQNSPQQATAAGPNYNAAAMAQGQYDLGSYGSSTASNNALMGGLFSLGGSLLGNSNFNFSDRGLKSNIRFLEKRGPHNWYSYTIFGKDEIGVMAQEVLGIQPEAVVVHDMSGYLTVDYSKLAA